MTLTTTSVIALLALVAVTALTAAGSGVAAGIGLLSLAAFNIGRLAATPGHAPRPTHAEV